RLDQGEPPLDRCPDRLLVQVRVEDDHDLVRSQRVGHQAKASFGPRPVPRAPAIAGEKRKTPGRRGRCSVVEPGEAIRSPRTSYRRRPYTAPETTSLAHYMHGPIDVAACAPAGVSSAKRYACALRYSGQSASLRSGHATIRAESSRVPSAANQVMSSG